MSHIVLVRLEDGYVVRVMSRCSALAAKRWENPPFAAYTLYLNMVDLE